MQYCRDFDVVYTRRLGRKTRYKKSAPYGNDNNIMIQQFHWAFLHLGEESNYVKPGYPLLQYALSSYGLMSGLLADEQ